MLLRSHRSLDPALYIQRYGRPQQTTETAADKPGFIPRIRDEFRANAAIKKTDVMHIEYLYRRAQRQLELLKDVNTKQLGSFSKSKEET
ncbi:hypothetical protein DNTS_034138 [Danionella cerebrum]|uniref:Complex 1 LYR protein domain-containing protein n=1 Tax=Danionella cerebrum TaxID=2873325 RepID=A0A553R6W4_9TELE|nr:hypothetical protein DNTS_034138 [Danionella translucida]